MDDQNCCVEPRLKMMSTGDDDRLIQFYVELLTPISVINLGEIGDFFVCV